MFLRTAYVLCSLKIPLLIEIIQTPNRRRNNVKPENFTARLQNSNRNSRLSWISLSGLEQPDQGAN